MNRILQKRLFFASIATALVFASSTLMAATSSLLGEQDYADGDVVGDNGVWLNAQAGEPYPFNTIHVAPATITLLHTGLDSGSSGVLTISLWDLDSELPGDQLSAFTINGIPQDLSAFEASQPNSNTIKIYQFPLDASYFASGQLLVSLSFSGPPDGNEVGIDFSRVDLNAPADSDGDGIPDSCDVDSHAGAADIDEDGIIDGSGCDTMIGPPRRKDQCKNGGWQLFNFPRVFNNQGDCIQFINTGK